MIGSSNTNPISERTSMIRKTLNSRVVSRPATAMTSISESQAAIQSAAMVLDDVVFIGGRSNLEGTAGIGDISAVCNGQICACSDAGWRAGLKFKAWEKNEKTGGRR